MASNAVSLGSDIPAALRASRDAIISMRVGVVGEDEAGVEVQFSAAIAKSRVADFARVQPKPFDIRQENIVSLHPAQKDSQHWICTSKSRSDSAVETNASNMPFLEVDTAAGKKRKRPEKDGQKTKSKKTAKASSHDTDDQEERILQLEAQVLESRKHYNNIAALLSLAKSGSDTSVLARVAICRIYCRLLAAGSLKVIGGAAESELVIVRWLKARLDEYLELVLAASQLNSTTLTLVMRLVKEEIKEEGTSAWENGIFPRLTQALLTSGSSTEALRAEYNLKYFQEYDDVRFQTLGCIV